MIPLQKLCALEQTWGKLDIVVNNVGMNIRRPTLDYSAQESETVLSINPLAAFHLNQLAYPLLKASGQGSIVNIASS